jgi:hypothetical protein
MRLVREKIANPTVKILVADSFNLNKMCNLLRAILAKYQKHKVDSSI